jgi:putative peptidoglycan lipid II flippase
VSNQVALLVATILAEPGSGGVTAYQAAFLFFQLPHGLLAVSIMTTFQPGLSLAALRGDQRGFDDRLALGLRAIALATLPASALYVVLARPLVAALLEHGAFSAAAVTATADVLVAFAVGLFAYSAYLFVLRGFYARQDTRTPFVLNVIENAINIALALVLVGPFGVVGIAASFSIAYFVSAALALVVLARRVGGLRLGPLAEGVVRLTMATVVAAGFAWLVVDRFGSQGGWGAVTTVLAGTVSLVAVYACGVLAFAPDELRSIVAAIRPTPEPAST